GRETTTGHLASPAKELINPVMPAEAPMPRATPTMPPRPDSSTASTRNCRKMSRDRAPTAMRMPISRVRSVTETSMMFMMPTPPTSSEMPAMADNNMVMVPVTMLMMLAISVMFWMRKSGGSPG